MRKLLLVPAGFVSISVINLPASAQPVPASPIHGNTPGHTCRAQGTDHFIGKPATKMMGAAIKDVTHAAVLRWAPPGTMLTMDFRADRVNVYVDRRRMITKINCG